MSDAPELSVVRRAARWAGIALDQEQIERLAAFADWLVEEAIPAGGLGPAEGPVVHSRHIADSLLFASGWDRSRPPRSLLDAGSGVGLPGIPLAVAWPACETTLLERSTRRADLARRAVRMLGLANVRVEAAQMQEWRNRSELVVSRGAGSPASLRADLARLVAPSGRVVIGGSRQRRPQARGYRVREVPENAMGHPVWLLIMDGT